MFDLVEFTIKGKLIYLSLLNADKLNIFCKTKIMLEIMREKLRILTILVHVKTVAIIVTYSSQIKRNS